MDLSASRNESVSISIYFFQGYNLFKKPSPFCLLTFVPSTTNRTKPMNQIPTLPPKEKSFTIYIPQPNKFIAGKAKESSLQKKCEWFHAKTKDEATEEKRSEAALNGMGLSHPFLRNHPRRKFISFRPDFRSAYTPWLKCLHFTIKVPTLRNQSVGTYRASSAHRSLSWKKVMVQISCACRAKHQKPQRVVFKWGKVTGNSA